MEAEVVAARWLAEVVAVAVVAALMAEEVAVVVEANLQARADLEVVVGVEEVGQKMREVVVAVG
jgi:hypothetical protein